MESLIIQPSSHTCAPVFEVSVRNCALHLCCKHALGMGHSPKRMIGFSVFRQSHMKRSTAFTSRMPAHTLPRVVASNSHQLAFAVASSLALGWRFDVIRGPLSQRLQHQGEVECAHLLRMLVPSVDYDTDFSKTAHALAQMTA